MESRQRNERKRAENMKKKKLFKKTKENESEKNGSAVIIKCKAYNVQCTENFPFFHIHFVFCMCVRVCSMFVVSSMFNHSEKIKL